MARVDIPLPGKDKDYDSRKSRAKLINLMIDTNQDGSFKSIVKREGTEIVFTADDGLISNWLVGGKDGSIDEKIVFTGLTNAYFLSSTAGVVSLSTIGTHSQGYGSVEIKGSTFNSAPDEYLFTDASNNAFITDGLSPGTQTTIVDAVYLANFLTIPTSLSGRFYLVQGTAPQNQFFASDLLDGAVYDALAFASADEKQGNIEALVSIKSGMYVFCQQNTEYWQTFDNSTFPLRRVQGASIGIGIAQSPEASRNAVTSFDVMYDIIGFVGSDLKVYLIENGQHRVISDIDFSNLVSTDKNYDFHCHFIDGSHHKYFVVTSINYVTLTPDVFEEFTWVYDLVTGQSHYRTSGSLPYWRMFYSGRLNGDSYMRELSTPGPVGRVPNVNVNRMSENLFDDNGTNFECILQSASLSFDKDSTIEFIEIEMETGVGNADSPDPEMTVEYSKDGGVNFVTWGTVKLGGSTDKSKRVRMDNFGRVVRHTDFILRLTITEPVRVEFYGAYAEITGGF